MRNLYIISFVISFVLLSCSSNDPNTYELTLTPVPQEAGTVTPQSGEFEEDRAIEISATPNQNWVFSRWEGDYNGEDNPAIITIDSDKQIAAMFVKKEYPLEISIEGEGTVSERVIQEKTTDYAHGTLVELTAVPEDGWEFSRWEGDLVSEENPETVLIESETSVTAVFVRAEFPLTVTIVGEGGVIDNDSMSVENASYISGTEVELTAVPADNWAFTQWSGDLDGSENPATLVMDGPKEVTATFVRTFRLTTVSSPDEGGSITPEAGDYIRDTTFDVEAIPNEGWAFDRWEGDFTGSVNPFSLTMNGNKTIVAHFERRAFTLNTDKEGSGNVAVNLISGTLTSDGYLFESEVQLVAVPDDDWKFVEWRGDLTGSENPVTISMDSDKTITAVFTIFEDGSGTEEDPYQVATIKQLQEIGNNLDAHFVQITDIDADETSGWNDGAGFKPVGDDFDRFTGSFDGNGFAVSNLVINRPDDFFVGLFGYLEDAEVRNVSLIDAVISGDERVGGLAGVNNGLISNSSFSGNMSGERFVGGIAGRNIGLIEDSFTSADIDGAEVSGGIAGVNSAQIIRSYATGSLTNGNIIGGLIGRNSGRVELSYSTGSVSGTNTVGGLIGENDASGEVFKSYNLGQVDGDARIGGLAGINKLDAVISESYSTGEITGSENTGGFAGINEGTISTSYWDNEASGQSESVGAGSETGVTGLTTEEMTDEDAETNMTGFDWVDTWITVISDYPILQWQND